MENKKRKEGLLGTIIGIIIIIAICGVLYYMFGEFLTTPNKYFEKDKEVRIQSEVPVEAPPSLDTIMEYWGAAGDTGFITADFFKDKGSYFYLMDVYGKVYAITYEDLESYLDTIITFRGKKIPDVNTLEFEAWEEFKKANKVGRGQVNHIATVFECEYGRAPITEYNEDSGMNELVGEGEPWELTIECFVMAEKDEQYLYGRSIYHAQDTSIYNPY